MIYRRERVYKYGERLMDRYRLSETRIFNSIYILKLICVQQV